MRIECIDEANDRRQRPPGDDHDRRSIPYDDGPFRDRQSAERAYDSLTTRGYAQDDVSLLVSDETPNRYFPKNDPAQTDLGSKAAEGAGIGAVAGGGLGALLAGLAASGIAVPGLPIIAVGALAAALTGGLTGGAVGALLGGLIGSGIPEDRAKLYERGVHEGGIVMGVTPRNDEDAEHLEHEWRNCGDQVYSSWEREKRDAA